MQKLLHQRYNGKKTLSLDRTMSYEIHALDQRKSKTELLWSVGTYPWLSGSLELGQSGGAAF